MEKVTQKLRRIEDEEWRDIPNSNGLYMISNYGRLKSFVLNKENGQIIKGYVVKKFHVAKIRINGKSETVFPHRLVAELWLPKPSEKHVRVAHLDRNYRNNHPSNLKWQTEEEMDASNAEYFRKLYKDKKKPGVVTNSRLKAKDIVLLKTMLQRGITQAKIAKMFCISEMQVTRIKRGENWAHVTIPDEKK